MNKGLNRTAEGVFQVQVQENDTIKLWVRETYGVDRVCQCCERTGRYDVQELIGGTNKLQNGFGREVEYLVLALNRKDDCARAKYYDAIAH